MKENVGGGHAHQTPTDPPKAQRFFDNIFLLLLLSILISGVIFNAWGLIENFTTPPLIP